MKIRVANFEMQASRICKLEKKKRIGVLYKPRYVFFFCESFTIGFEKKKDVTYC